MNPWRLRATLVGQGGLRIARWGRQRQQQRDLVDALLSDLVTEYIGHGVGVICALMGHVAASKTRTLVTP